MYPATIFGVSLMLSEGRGFVEPQEGVVPEMDRFLRQEIERFDTRLLPNDLPTNLAASWIQRHRYMIHAVSWAWRLTGPSWDGFKIVLLLLYVATGLAAYCFFRVFARPWFALAGAVCYANAPLFVFHIGDARDFGKAPFIVGAIAIMAALLGRPVPARRHIALSAALGMTIALGYGFRNDPIICLPAAVFVVAACGQLKSAKHPWLVRASALAALSLSFAVCAWPIIRDYDDSGAPVHDLIMGQSAANEQLLGLRPTAYDEMPMVRDDYVYALVTDYARITRPEQPSFQFKSKESEAVAKRYLLCLARLFPADFLVRGYAAATRILCQSLFDSGKVHVRRQWDYFHSDAFSPRATAFIGGMLLLAAGAFAGVAGRNPRLAWQALILGLYFCAYPALQYQNRHVFHLAIFPIGLIVFWLSIVPAWLRAGYRRFRVGRIDGPLFDRAAATRGLLWLAAAVLVLLGSLAGTRAYQAHNVRVLTERYRHTDLDPLSVRRRPLDGWILFQPPTRVLERSTFPTCQTWPYEQDYLAVTLRLRPGRGTAWLLYETENGINDFSMPFTIPPSVGGDEKLTYFFQVHESRRVSHYGAWSRFVGVALPVARESDFVGIARVGQNGAFVPRLHFSLADPPKTYPDYQRIRLAFTGWPDAVPLPEPFEMVERARGAPADQAETLLRHAIDTDPGMVQARLGLAQVLEKQGRLDGARNALRQAIGVAPQFPAAYEGYDAFLVEHLTPEKRVEAWAGTRRQHPGLDKPALFHGRALLESGREEEAADVLAAAVALGADDYEARTLWARALCACDRPASAARAWAPVIAEQPELAPDAAALVLQALQRRIGGARPPAEGDEELSDLGTLARSTEVWIGAPEAVEPGLEPTFTGALDQAARYCREIGDPAAAVFSRLQKELKTVRDGAL